MKICLNPEEIRTLEMEMGDEKNSLSFKMITLDESEKDNEITDKRNSGELTEKEYLSDIWNLYIKKSDIKNPLEKLSRQNIYAILTAVRKANNEVYEKKS
jgi:hypothetical protein